MFRKQVFLRRPGGWLHGEACGSDDWEPGQAPNGPFIFRKLMHRHFSPPRHFGPPHHFGPGGHLPPFGGHGPFGGPSDDDGGRRRHRRGDLKYVLLELLAERACHGYELIKELEQRYAGFYRPSPGSVYPTLQLLEDEGSVTSEPVEGKRVYTITDAGRQALEERQRSAGPHRAGPGGAGPDPELEGLQRSAMALLSSVKEVARHGTSSQRQAALAQLDTTRRELYRILSQAEPDTTV